MSWSDLELISTVAGKVKKYDSQVEWAEAAVMVARRDGAREKDIRRINKIVANAKKEHDDILMQVWIKRNC